MRWFCEIGNRVWIRASSFILEDFEIGDNIIVVGLMTKVNIPSNSFDDFTDEKLMIASVLVKE